APVPLRLERPRLRPHRRRRLVRVRGSRERAWLRLRAEPARLPPPRRPPGEAAARRRTCGGRSPPDAAGSRAVRRLAAPFPIEHRGEDGPRVTDLHNVAIGVSPASEPRRAYDPSAPPLRNGA